MAKDHETELLKVVEGIESNLSNIIEGEENE